MVCAETRDTAIKNIAAVIRYPQLFFRDRDAGRAALLLLLANNRGEEIAVGLRKDVIKDAISSIGLGTGVPVDPKTFELLATGENGKLLFATDPISSGEELASEFRQLLQREEENGMQVVGWYDVHSHNFVGGYINGNEELVSGDEEYECPEEDER